MNAVDFCFWLQGYFEISGADSMTDDELEVIRSHLDLVFVHEIDPMREKETSALPSLLNKVHGGNDPKMRC